jgi:hypothetical protein
MAECIEADDLETSRYEWLYEAAQLSPPATPTVDEVDGQTVTPAFGDDHSAVRQ